MSKDQNQRFPRKDVTYVPVTEVEEIKGEMEHEGKVFKENVRTDYGDLKLLAKQIVENGGIRIPCKAIKKDGKYYLTDGHRRYRAAKLVLEETGEIVDIPIMTEKGVTEEKRVIDMIICNEGKPLNPVEQADAVSRLIECGLDESTIMDKTGFSNVYICNLKMLHNAPKKIKDLIVNNIISATLAMSVMRKEKDFDKAIESIENAIEFKQASSGTSKITKRDMVKANKKVNSFSAIKKAYKHFEKNKLTVRQDKIEIFTFISRIMDGDITYDELMATIYEPEQEDKPEKVKGKSKKSEEVED